MQRFLLVVLVCAIVSGFGSAVMAQIDSVPWSKLPNVEASQLDANAKERAVRVMKAENCYFECSSTVYQCVTAGAPVKTALRMAGLITRQAARGKPEKEIKQAVMNRAKSVHPFKTAQVNLDNAFCTGPKDAPVVVVAFADFDCPFCRIVSPILKKLALKDDGLTYCLKLFPVKGHGKLAIETSKAGVAADEQGKFWAFHDIMYENFESHSESDIKGYIGKLGMDYDRYVEKRDEARTKKLVVASKREGLQLGVKSTPSVYINGKRYHGEKSEIEFKDRIEEEQDLAP